MPWLGYVAGWTVAKVFQQDTKDRLAIAIEAGIQNTGIAIFILRFALGQVGSIQHNLPSYVFATINELIILLINFLQPQADLTTIIPVSVAIMTPLPLIGFWICLKCRDR